MGFTNADALRPDTDGSINQVSFFNYFIIFLSALKKKVANRGLPSGDGARAQ